MVRMEFGINCTGTKEYLSRRLVMKGWRGSRRPALRNASYTATLPGREVTLSSGVGMNNRTLTGIPYLALRFTNVWPVTVEAAPSGDSPLTLGG